MRLLSAVDFYKITLGIGKISEFFRAGPGKQKAESGEKLSDGDKAKLTSVFEPLVEHCTSLGAVVTKMAVEETLKLFERDSSFADLDDAVRDMEKTLRREMKLVVLFSVDRQKQSLIQDGAHPFGANFEKQYPSAAFEVQEAGYCLALDRNTASVFHLMRIMETLLRSMALCLALPAPTGAGKNWGAMLQTIKQNMEERAKGKHGGWQAADKELFAELFASVDAVRVAWRNTTMHVERNYDAEEADHLFAVVRAFAKKLAARCDEQGQPAA